MSQVKKLYMFNFAHMLRQRVFVIQVKQINLSLIAMLTVDKNLKQAEGWKTGARCPERGGK